MPHGTPWGGLILLMFLGRGELLMLHVGLDLSRKRVDVCLISGEGELVERFRSPCDRDGVYGLSRRVAVYDEPVRGVIESMNGARFVHDELVRQRVKGLAPLACKTECAARRLVVSPAQPGGTRREVLGSNGLPRVERRTGQQPARKAAAEPRCQGRRVAGPA